MNKELQELNEKLLRFAGFEPCTTIDGWWYPLHGATTDNLPDLTSSLDAQVKWLWPKIEKLIGFYIYETPEGWNVTMEIGTGPSLLDWVTYQGHDKTLALAAARAIEQVIDSNKKGER